MQVALSNLLHASLQHFSTPTPRTQSAISKRTPLASRICSLDFPCAVQVLLLICQFLHRVRPPHLSADYLLTSMCDSTLVTQPTASSRLKDILNEMQCDPRLPEASFSQTFLVYTIAFCNACSSLSSFAFFLPCNLLPSRLRLPFCLLASFTPDSHLTRLPWHPATQSRNA